MTKFPRLTPARRGERVARDERLARALRENLHRRKQQARAKRPGLRDGERADGTGGGRGDDPPA